MLRILVTAASAMLALAAQAQEADYGSLNKEGFGDVAGLMQSMTPQQCQAVMEQAAQKQQDLKKLSPQQLQELEAQLHKEAGTIDLQKVDPAKLNIAKAKPTQGTLQDLNTYQQKYEQGKLKNPVLKSQSSDE